MVKIQQTKQGSYIISLPKIYLRHTGWGKGTSLAICPCENGNGLRLVELKNCKV